MSEQENIEAHWEDFLIVRAEAAEAECLRLNHCLDQLIPAEREWRKRAEAAGPVVAELVDACKAALFPAGDTPAEVEAQLRTAIATADLWQQSRAALTADAAKMGEPLCPDCVDIHNRDTNMPVQCPYCGQLVGCGWHPMVSMRHIRACGGTAAGAYLYGRESDSTTAYGIPACPECAHPYEEYTPGCQSAEHQSQTRRMNEMRAAAPGEEAGE